LAQGEHLDGQYQANILHQTNLLHPIWCKPKTPLHLPCDDCTEEDRTRTSAVQG